LSGLRTLKPKNLKTVSKNLGFSRPGAVIPAEEHKIMGLYSFYLQKKLQTKPQ